MMNNYLRSNSLKNELNFDNNTSINRIEMIFVHMISWPPCRCTPIHYWMGCGPHLIRVPHPIYWWMEVRRHEGRKIIRTNIITLNEMI